jgi:hypothetical protein
MCTVCIYVIHVIFSINSHHLPKQHPIDVYDRD